MSVALVMGVSVMTGCRGERVQSALHPEGPAAQVIAEFWWFMCVALGVIFVAVCAVIAWGLRSRRPLRAPGTWFIVAGGIALPAAVSLAIMVYSLITTLALQRPSNPPLTIEVIGHQWWWEVRYPDHDIISANELHIPVGKPVRLELRAADVIHSFWVPQLHGKMDLLPDHVNTFWIQADRPGRFRGQCAEFCGVQHARMAFFVIAHEPEAFNNWTLRMRQPHPPAETELELRGQRAFFDANCHACHAVRGTDAVARVGPDLTHFADRRSIGAGQLPNTPEHLADWILDPHDAKPGNLMPATPVSPADLRAMVAYLLATRDADAANESEGSAKR